ncbi:hypothetical protein LAZ67_10002406 [Cordylochernes scorpioides]|uniref:Uncharacterized protein n=1 Tax=Cordylochernes scorpioides TaxID=51811 RepID=A0ABY6L0G3_9ARAC|nr:hypothetical protein LAZ67_10002406 [Cordylochernes scorpioides]
METSEALHWTRQQQQKIDMDPEQQLYAPKIVNIETARTKERHKLDKIGFDKNHRFPDFEVGDLVLTKIYQHANTGKLVPYFSGPYEIIEVISPYIVRINRPNQAQNLDTEIIHVKKLKHYSEDTKYIFTPYSMNNNSVPKLHFIYHHFPPEIFHDDYKNYASTLSNPFNHMNPDILLDKDGPTLTARYISTSDTIPKIDIQLEPSSTTKIMLPSSPTRNYTPEISPQLSDLLINSDNAKLENSSKVPRTDKSRAKSKMELEESYCFTWSMRCPGYNRQGVTPMRKPDVDSNIDEINSRDDTNFEAGASSEPHLLTQGDLNDLIRDFDLSKKTE